MIAHTKKWIITISNTLEDFVWKSYFPITFPDPKCFVRFLWIESFPMKRLASSSNFQWKTTTSLKIFDRYNNWNHSNRMDYERKSIEIQVSWTDLEDDKCSMKAKQRLAFVFDPSKNEWCGGFQPRNLERPCQEGREEGEDVDNHKRIFKHCHPRQSMGIELAVLTCTCVAGLFIRIPDWMQFVL